MFQLSLDFLGRQLDRLKPVQVSRSRRIDHDFIWKHGLSVRVMFSARARRYLLRLQPDGTVRLVIPRRGTEAEGIRFLERSEGWLMKRRAAWQSHSHARQPWIEDTRFLFRGEEVALKIEIGVGRVELSFSDQDIILPHALADYRDAVLDHLSALAERELPTRTRELALVHGIAINRVTVRSQKTRWGSCSARGTISLNWRLIHAPAHVVDYLIIHELMHRREMNHSKRYWKLVAEACPGYRAAEQWLKKTRLEAMGLGES
jgi:predicted metal-dependent hydrolase